MQGRRTPLSSSRVGPVPFLRLSRSLLLSRPRLRLRRLRRSEERSRCLLRSRLPLRLLLWCLRLRSLLRLWPLLLEPRSLIMNFGGLIQSILPLSVASVRRTRSLGRTSLHHQPSQITTNHFYVLGFLCHFLSEYNLWRKKLILHASLKSDPIYGIPLFVHSRLIFERQFLANSPSSNSLPWKKNVRRECPARRHRSICVSLSRSGHLRRMRYACRSVQ